LGLYFLWDFRSRCCSRFHKNSWFKPQTYSYTYWKTSSTE